MFFVHTGSNGAEFMFLLKGHEDLRQDERVVQLFGLVNTPACGRSRNIKETPRVSLFFSLVLKKSALCNLLCI